MAVKYPRVEHILTVLTSRGADYLFKKEPQMIGIIREEVAKWRLQITAYPWKKQNFEDLDYWNISGRQRESGNEELV